MCGTLVMPVRLVRLSGQVKIRIRTVYCPCSTCSSDVRIVVTLIPFASPGIVASLVTPVVAETCVTFVSLVSLG